MNIKNYIMKEVINLASRGLYTASPNPLVGCIIEKHGNIISDGWHHSSGNDHAEIVALKKAGEMANGANMYVNLEPCCHFGKTPPCVEAIIKAKIKKIYISTKDPNPIVNGLGIEKLRKVGIEVEIGLGHEEAFKLNQIYFHYITNKKPFVIAKWAMSLDGRGATSSGKSKWISSIESRLHAHKIRKSVDAILVGSNTALFDNPRLTVRLDGSDESDHKQPTRIILNSNGNLPINLNVFTDSFSSKTIIAITDNCLNQNIKKFLQANIKILVLKQNENKQICLNHLLEELGKLEIASLLVEGGSKIHTSFIRENLINKLYTYIAPKLIGGNSTVCPIGCLSKDFIPKFNSFNFENIQKIGSDVLLTSSYLEE